MRRTATRFMTFAIIGLLTGAAGAQQAGPAPGETLSESYRGSQRDNNEYQKVAPIKVFDNLYYVGPGAVSVWLIPTTDGLILVDSAQEPLVDHVIDSIRKVGLRPEEHQVHPPQPRPSRSLRRRRAGSRRSRARAWRRSRRTGS